MGMEYQTVDDIKEMEDRIVKFLAKLREFRADWASEGPAEVKIETTMAIRSIDYLEAWTPLQQARLTRARQAAKKEEVKKTKASKKK
ncbi:hypothetical protein LOC68_09760 [Blastopirellula sp. JC732]|uniref:Uncharacterized protein n=1 Tax=Blastopirellula sediminis TaxID=2894196 RepID=A0A9X1MKC7_9BACT|nr:hypothetical protein [Blastopirellula sediminis]MCC9608540.1 hypothetical protein [Blastopirellula sediminis]MCC9628683.1 hypothetical protein [Blastopirellula sediminis]